MRPVQVWSSNVLRLARRELAAVLAILVLTGGTLGFLELADEVGDNESLTFDRAILLSLRDPATPAETVGPRWVERAMVDITSLGSTTCLTLITLFTAGLLFALRRQLEAILVVASVGGATIGMTLLKDLFARTRPDVVPHLVNVYSESFPSGHAMVAAAAYLTLGVLGAHAATRRVGLYVLTCAIALTGLIGISRIYLGVHYPTDVLAGWAAGSAWAMGCWLITVALQRRDELKRLLGPRH